MLDETPGVHDLPGGSGVFGRSDTERIFKFMAGEGSK
jgi:hypothetical protein